MEKIAILADSTSDVNENLRNRDNVYIIPLYVNMDGKYLKDQVDISPEEVLEYNDNHPGDFAKTSAPSPGDMQEIIDQIRNDGYEKIIVITISSKMSATYNTFKNLTEDDPDIHVVDSKSVSLMGSLMVAYADDLIKEGLDFKMICDKLENLEGKKMFYAWVDSLDNLVNGGRLPAPVGRAVSFLNIKPIIKVSSEGKLEIIKLKVKEEKAIDQLLNKIRKDIGDTKKYYLGIGHGGDFELFEKVQEKASDLIDNSIFYNGNPFGCVVRTHAGKRSFSVFYLKAD